MPASDWDLMCSTGIPYPSPEFLSYPALLMNCNRRKNRQQPKAFHTQCVAMVLSRSVQGLKCKENVFLGVAAAHRTSLTVLTIYSYLENDNEPRLQADKQQHQASLQPRPTKSPIPRNPKEAMSGGDQFSFLERIGADPSKVVARFPAFTTCTMHQLKEVREFLEAIGMYRKDLGRLINLCPEILGCSVKGQLKPAADFLSKELGLCKKNLRKVINRCPRLLICSVPKQLRPTMRYLQRLGYTQLKKVVLINSGLLTFSIREKINPKIQYLEKLGFSHDEAVNIVLRVPALFSHSTEDNLQVKYDYLVNVMKRGLSDLKAFPQFFCYSLDNRIRPRFEFLASNNIPWTLRSMLEPKDDEFYAKYKDRIRKVPQETGKTDPSRASEDETSCGHHG